MRKTFQFKLYSSKKNQKLIRRIKMVNHARNYLLAIQKRSYRMFGKYANKYRMKRLLPRLKTRFPEWKEIGSQALQDLVYRLDFGYQQFFRKENKRPPQFRKRSRAKSFT